MPPRSCARRQPPRLGPARTRQLLIPPLPGRARSPAAPAALALAVSGQRGPRSPGGGVRSRRRLSIGSYAPSPAVRRRLPLRPGALTHGVLVVIAAKRKRGGRRRPPGLDQCRVPPRDRQARRGRHPRAAAGHRDRRSRLPRQCRAPASRNPAAQCLRQDRRCCRRDHADARPLLSAAKHLRLPRGSPRQWHADRQPGTPAAFPVNNYVTYHVDNYVTHHLCCRGEGDRPAGAGTRDHRPREPGHETAQPLSGEAGGRWRQLRERPGAAGPVTLARRARKRRHRRTARPVEQGTPHNEHAEVAVRGHTQAATTRKEVPCPTRL